MEGLIGEAGANKAGLLSAQKFKEYPHFLKGYNSTYKIASNIKDWERQPIMVMHNYGENSYLEVISYVASTETLTAKVSYVLQKTDSVKYYKKTETFMFVLQMTIQSLIMRTYCLHMESKR